MFTLPRLTKIVVSVIIFLVILEVVIANRLATAGFTLDSLSFKEQTTQEENEILEKKIATFSSLIQVAKEAEKEGFVKAQTLYLVPELPVALEKSNAITAR